MERLPSLLNTDLCFLGLLASWWGTKKRILKLVVNLLFSQEFWVSEIMSVKGPLQENPFYK